MSTSSKLLFFDVCFITFKFNFWISEMIWLTLSICLGIIIVRIFLFFFLNKICAFAAKISSFCSSEGLSLTFKEEFELSELFISSYADDKININNINYDFPICIFGQKIFEISLKDLKAFTSEHIKYLNSKYFSLNTSYPELILIGIKDYNFKDILRLRDISEKNKIGLDLMKIGQASGTFNFLTLEKRDFITIFI